MYVITDFGLDPTVDPLTIVNKFKHKPAVLGWNIAADVDNGKVYTPSRVSDLHCQFIEADSEHLTYIRLSKLALCY